MTRPNTTHLAGSSPRPQPVPDDLEGTLRRHGFTLGDWRVEPLGNRIVSEGGERSLDPKLIDVLVALALRRGEVITREELLRQVWNDVIVSENTLSQAVSRLRKALGDDPRRPRYVETISKSGYRLLAPVSWNEQVLELQAVETLDHQEVAGRPWLVWALALTLVAVVTLLVVRNIPPPPPPLAQVRPELTLLGKQFDPRLSPDGNTIAFAWQGPDQGDFDLWLQPLGADNPVQLTDHAHEERLPAWSPDGGSLAFVRFKEGESCGLYRMPVPGSSAERLGDCMPGMRFLAWSPDGNTLVFNGMLEGTQTRALFGHDIATGERRQWTTPAEGTPGDSHGAFSPDGSMLAFARAHGAHRHDVMVLSVGDGAPRPLTSDAWGQLRGVQWSSAGDAVLFASNRAGRYALWKVPVAGGEPERVPIADTWVTHPSVSAAGGRLIYRTFRDSVDIWELPLDDDGMAAGEPERRVYSSRTERHPAWSPQADAIAFLSDRTGPTELWSGQPDGTGLLRHTDLGGPLPGSPAWSPDGRLLVYDAAVHGHSDLWLVERDSRRSRRLTDSESEDRNGTFSRDGLHLYFASDRSGAWEIWRMPVEGGNAEQVTEGGGFLAQESPDGRLLYYARPQEAGIWRRPTAGGESEQIVSDLDLADWGNWAVGENGIYYVTRPPTTIRLAGFDGGEPRLIRTPAKQMPYLGRALSLSGDGRSLLFSMIDHSDDEVMVADLPGL